MTAPHTSAVLLAAVFAVVISLSGGVGVVTAQMVMPTPATAYSTVVAINFDRGFTLSYGEYWDGASNRLRTDGRFAASDVSQIIDFSANVLYQWKPADPTYACIAVSTTVEAGIIPPTLLNLLQPSRSNLLRSDGVTPVYAGMSTAARTIQANLWTATTSSSTDTTQTSSSDSYYWTQPDSKGITTPIRLERQSIMRTRQNSSMPWTETGTHTYFDWVYYVPGTPDTSMMALPTRCVGIPVATSQAQAGATVGALFNLTIPSSPQVKPQPVNPNVPSISSYFRLVLESKLTSGAQTVTAMKWYVMGDQYERVDYLDANFKTVSLIYDYTQPNALVFNYSATAQTCTTSQLSNSNASPLYARAGALPKLFSNVPGFFNTPTYEGRMLARGVPSDWFLQRERQLSNPYIPSAAFNFDMQVLFFPEGWVFPGREGVTSSIRLPIRIVNNGSMSTYNDAGTAIVSTTQYNDVWDIFQYIPTQPALTMFDAVTLYGCSAQSPQPPETYSTSKAGTIAGVIVGVILAVALGYGGFRWWKSHKQQFHANIQGMAKAETETTTTTTAGARA